MKVSHLPAASYLVECFSETGGVLQWKKRPLSHFKSERSCRMWNAKFAGKIAGRKMQKYDYWQVMIEGVRYLNHRVVAQMHGIDTSVGIDHRNGDPSDNRPENLRACSWQQNTWNNRGWSKKKSATGTWQTKGGRWIAYIREGGRHRHIGTFDSESEAKAARIAAEARVYGEFAHHQRTPSANGIPLQDRPEYAPG